MLIKTSPLLRSGLVAAAVALLPLSEVGAQLVPDVLQRACTAGSQANVVAGEGGNPNALFPRVVNCPADCPGALSIGTGQELAGQFLAWDYQWTQIGKSAPSQLGLQVASDIQIEGASPGLAGWSEPGQEESSLKLGLNDWDSRWLRFPGINAGGIANYTYYTKTNVLARPEGVASRSGNTTSTCKLAGAGTLSGDPNLARPLTVTSTVFGCKVTWTRSADGCVTNAVVDVNSGPGCDQLRVETEVDPIPTIPPTKAASCTAEVNKSGSAPCYYQQWNSGARRWVTVYADTSPPCSP